MFRSINPSGAVKL